MSFTLIAYIDMEDLITTSQYPCLVLTKHIPMFYTQLVGVLGLPRNSTHFNISSSSPHKIQSLASGIFWRVHFKNFQPTHLRSMCSVRFRGFDMS